LPHSWTKTSGLPEPEFRLMPQKILLRVFGTFSNLIPARKLR
jgi:hypothetical protein